MPFNWELGFGQKINWELGFVLKINWELGFGQKINWKLGFKLVELTGTSLFQILRFTA